VLISVTVGGRGEGNSKNKMNTGQPPDIVRFGCKFVLFVHIHININILAVNICEFF
jgi:hypothetical protein